MYVFWCKGVITMNFDESFCKVENINNDFELFEILELVYINYASSYYTMIHKYGSDKERWFENIP